MMRWASAPHNAYRVLLRMALTALDEPSASMPAGMYFGGHELLTTVIPAGDGATAESRQRAVKRAVADLVAMGAIERSNKARSGANQVYRLTLRNAVRPLEKKPNKRFAIDEPLVDNFIGPDVERDTMSPPVGDNGCPAEGDTVSPERGTPGVPPRNQEEPIQEKYQEEDLIFADLSPSARARGPNQDGFIPPPQCRNRACSRGWILPTTNNGEVMPCPVCNSNVIRFPTERKSA